MALINGSLIIYCSVTKGWKKFIKDALEWAFVKLLAFLKVPFYDSQTQTSVVLKLFSILLFFIIQIMPNPNKRCIETKIEHILSYFCNAKPKQALYWNSPEKGEKDSLYKAKPKQALYWNKLKFLIIFLLVKGQTQTSVVLKPIDG